MTEVDKILCMNGGEGETSYAGNSLLQKEMILKSKSILEESMRELYLGTFPDCLRIADLGCSSGPNTLLFVSEILDLIYFTCQELKHKGPTFQVYLNDLPGNDFNTIFRSLPSFYEKLEKEKGMDFGPCFIAGLPGTFYGRLFPDHYLHFVHSNYSLHWRSQVPEGLVSKSGIPLNKGNIYIAKTSPISVFTSYLQLFERDFALFLRSRSQEMIPGGYMVLTMIGSDKKFLSGNHSYTLWELLGITLNDMVQEGLLQEEKLDSFNIPLYAPTVEEVRNIIETGGSFEVMRLETVKLDWDVNMDKANDTLRFGKHGRGKYVAKGIRVVTQPILASHFGEEIIDNLFEKFAMKMDEYLEAEKGEYTNIVVSLKKRTNL